TWLINRYKLPVDTVNPDINVLPVTGTREALFAIAHCVIDSQLQDPMVVTGNPFYQIYEGAGLLAGASMWYVNTLEENQYLPDYSNVPDHIWERCQLLYICSPNNPTGMVMNQQEYELLFKLSDRYNFVIAADECYSEIYQDESQPPLGILQAADVAGRRNFKNIIIFHSLSKRSNVPGMRSGFVAGDPDLLTYFYQYRTYHGCAMSPYIQEASIAAWNDESHVIENRNLYREKFDAVLDILGPVMEVYRPQAGFYLWPKTPIDDVEFTRLLVNNENVTVLPGSFTSREVEKVNPGKKRIRMALVASLDDCITAAKRIKKQINSL
ncbi:MAG: succinyldiaminopimelate transaminase, partial [Gammaproteobacteria bacterium]|nr:succinyldiaminopimelate transaminase [Gammaproteobacteria bacterium]